MVSKMISACFKIISWRLWDFIVKIIWKPLPNFSKNLLWKFISSKEQVRNHVDAALSASAGAVIQVGSNDGVSNAPLYESIVRHKRQAFLVEPINYLAEKLRLLHKDNNFVNVLEYAIHPTNASVDFYHMPKDADKNMGSLWKPWFDQIGSFSKQHLIKHSPSIEPFIEKTSISCKTLNQLVLEKNIRFISILHIDAEGFDLEVLSSINLEFVKPHMLMLMLEHKHLNLKPLFLLVGKMIGLGYKANVYHDDIIFTHALRI